MYLFQVLTKYITEKFGVPKDFQVVRIIHSNFKHALN